jgi:hypothetical protein
MHVEREARARFQRLIDNDDGRRVWAVLIGNEAAANF